MNFILPLVKGMLGGALAWFLTERVLRPITRYRDIKMKILASLTEYGGLFVKYNDSKEHNALVDERCRANRRHAGELRAAYYLLPKWYQWMLKRRSEDPSDAAKSLIGLSNDVYSEQEKGRRYFQERQREIRKRLLLPDEE